MSYLNKDTDLSAASGTKNYRINREGVYNLQIKITDAFGNNTSRYTKYVYDVTAPVIRLTAPAETNTRGTSIGYTLSDNIMGDKIVAHVTRRGPSGNVEYDQDMSETAWSGTGATGSIPFDAEGNYTVYLVAYDKAGNKSQSEPVTFVIDKTAPVLSISGMNDMQNTDVNATFTMNEAFGVVNGKSPEATVTITKRLTAVPQQQYQHLITEASPAVILTRQDTDLPRTAITALPSQARTLQEMLQIQLQEISR